MLKGLWGLILLFGFVVLNPAQARDCGRHHDISFCFDPGDPESTQLIYFFHGYGDHVESWNQTFATRGVVREWESAGVKRPHIVNMSRGPWWYTSPLHADDYDQFLKWFEATYINFTPTRVLYGESMGAHNAYRWLIDSPLNFERVALTCPAFPKYFVTDAPHESWAGFMEFLAEQVIGLAYSFAMDPNYNPLHHSLNEKTLSTIKAAHVVVLSNDSYGFYDGGMALYRKLSQETSLVTTIEVQQGRHCEHEASALARFLVTSLSSPALSEL